MDVAEIIRRKAAQYGVDPGEALRFAEIESNLKPGAKSPSGNHGGLYQFSSDLWKKYGKGGSIFDPEANADAFMRWHKEVLQPTAAKIAGDKAEPWQRYLVHQQGVGGAEGLLANPDQPAVEALAPYYVSKNDPLGLRTARSAVVGNGGIPTYTSGEFAEMWRNKYNGVAPLPPSQIVAAVSDPAMNATALNGGQQDADMAGYGGSPRLRDLAQPKPKDFNYAGLLNAGMQMAALGAGGGEQQTWQPGAPAPVHRPDMQNLGLLNPFVDPEAEKKKRQMMGLL
jgi:hypothetical protein